MNLDDLERDCRNASWEKRAVLALRELALREIALSVLRAGVDEALRLIAADETDAAVELLRTLNARLPTENSSSPDLAKCDPVGHA